MWPKENIVQPEPNVMKMIKTATGRDVAKETGEWIGDKIGGKIGKKIGGYIGKQITKDPMPYIVY